MIISIKDLELRSFHLTLGTLLLRFCEKKNTPEQEYGPCIVQWGVDTSQFFELSLVILVMTRPIHTAD